MGGGKTMHVEPHPGRAAIPDIVLLRKIVYVYIG
jgi:hypothetical protein